MKGQETNRRLDILPGLCSYTNCLESSKVNTFAQLIDGNVGGCANQDLTTADLAKVVDDGGGRNCLSSTRRALNQTEWLLEDALYSIVLTVVELRKAWNAELAGNRNLHRGCCHFVTKQTVEDVARNTHLINSKRLHSMLHAVKGGSFPDIVGTEVVSAFGRN
ncbi:hypothetical protein COCCADRAFT_96921 [Bipolaris zeicola 26-R-13]|uniref:Uncharacterized protein n=1 Tax=Cochliobolus carbonum (strain 26-R-13) TaxID=930089 RepID=W6YNS7_COCC2|nr:uncharacterized protein COCCADRAFT_96921 [Bipolaris zeicola 26-R-13]EUC33111.1 hypothetical protein COCCADRAFT_96921 [Bipolaris zeicola 26-R-13]